MESQSQSISNDGSQRGSRTPIGRNVRGTERGKRGGRGSGSGGGRGSFSSEKYVHGVNGDLVIRFDGACRGNPGPGAIGVVAYRCVDVSIHRQVQDKIHLKTFAEVQEYFQGPTTNNEMEYTAIIHALNVAQRRLTHEQLVSQMNSFTNKIIFQGDSSLVVKQLRGEFQVHEPRLKSLYDVAKERLNVLRQKCSIVLEIIPRQKNSVADALAKEALDTQRSDTTYGLDAFAPVSFFPSISVRKKQQSSIAPKGAPSAISTGLSTSVKVTTRLWLMTKKWLQQLVDLFFFVHHEKVSLEKIRLALDHLGRMNISLRENIAMYTRQDYCIHTLPPKYPDVLWQQIQAIKKQHVAKYDEAHRGLIGVSIEDEHVKESSGNEPLQARYLLAQLIVYEGEYSVREAEYRAHEKDWEACGKLSTLAYEQINHVLVQNDSWYAQALQAQEKQANQQSIPDVSIGGDTSHNLQQIQILLQRIEISRDHAHFIKSRILTEAEKRRQYLKNKLNPMWQSRDEVKDRIGLKRWKNNPNPKQDHAIQRVVMEEELHTLEETMEKLCQLTFVSHNTS